MSRRREQVMCPALPGSTACGRALSRTSGDATESPLLPDQGLLKASHRPAPPAPASDAFQGIQRHFQEFWQSPEAGAPQPGCAAAVRRYLPPSRGPGAEHRLPEQG